MSAGQSSSAPRLHHQIVRPVGAAIGIIRLSAGRLCTMFPLETIITPRCRSAANFIPKATWYYNGFKA